MAKHLKISGRVQGVGFRYSFAAEAERLGVTGCRRDGTLEAVADGEPEALETLLTWAHRGPPSARVSDVRVEEIPGTFERFELRPTE